MLTHVMTLQRCLISTLIPSTLAFRLHSDESTTPQAGSSSPLSSISSIDLSVEDVYELSLAELGSF